MPKRLHTLSLSLSLYIYIYIKPFDIHIDSITFLRIKREDEIKEKKNPLEFSQEVMKHRYNFGSKAQ